MKKKNQTMKDLEFYMFYGTYWEKIIAWFYYFNSLIKHVIIRSPPPYMDDPFGPNHDDMDDHNVIEPNETQDYFEDEC